MDVLIRESAVTLYSVQLRLSGGGVGLRLVLCDKPRWKILSPAVGGGAKIRVVINREHTFDADISGLVDPDLRRIKFTALCVEEALRVAGIEQRAVKEPHDGIFVPGIDA